MANYIHPSAQIADFVSIEISSKGTHTTIGAHSVIDDFVKIKHVGGLGSVEIGEEVYINSCCVFYSGNGIKIGNKVLIGPNCNIVPTNHNFDSIDLPIRNQGFQDSKGGVIIEDDVWLGANVTLLDGAIIRKGCIIAAGAVVNGPTEPFGIYAGIPAKKIKSRI